MPSEDYRKGKLLPSPVTPLTNVCYTIQIPNAVQYRAAFLGQLDVLGRADTWDHPTDGTVCEDCEEAAQIWRNALYNAAFDENCEGGMDCAGVAECIENNILTQQALANAIENSAVLQQILLQTGGANNFNGGLTVPGVGLTPSQMSTRLNEIDECAFDPYWAQVEQFIDYLVDLGQDTLEKLALYAIALNAGTATGKMAGLLAKLKNGTTAGKVAEFLNWAAGTMKSAYEAADDTANRNAIKCALFCENRDSCLITLDGLGATLNERLGGALDPSSITSLAGLAETIVTITTDPSLALDLWLTFLVGSAKTAGILGLEGIDETIQLMLAVAVNDANDDWRTLCTDCPAGWCKLINFELTDGSEFGVGGTIDYFGGFSGSQWESGKGLISVDPSNTDRTFAQLTFDVPIENITVTMVWGYENPTGGGNVWLTNHFDTAGPTGAASPQTVFQQVITDETTKLVFGGERSGSDFTPFIYLKALQIEGEGDIPVQFGSSNC